MPIPEGVKSVARNVSEGLNVLTVAGMSLLAAHFYYNGKIPEKVKQEIWETIPPDEVKEPREIKIEEITIIFGENGVRTQESTDELGLLKEKVAYLKKYLELGDGEFEIFKSKPTVPGVCDFFVKLISNQETKDSMKFVWEFVLRNKDDENIRLALSGLMKEVKIPFVYSPSEKHWTDLLGKPAKEEDFEKHFSACQTAINNIPKRVLDIDKVRSAIKKLFSAVINNMTTKLEKDGKDEYLTKAVREMLNLTYERFPETNR